MVTALLMLYGLSGTASGGEFDQVINETIAILDPVAVPPPVGPEVYIRHIPDPHTPGKTIEAGSGPWVAAWYVRTWGRQGGAWRTLKKKQEELLPAVQVFEATIVPNGRSVLQELGEGLMKALVKLESKSKQEQILLAEYMEHKRGTVRALGRVQQSESGLIKASETLKSVQADFNAFRINEEKSSRLLTN